MKKKLMKTGFSLGIMTLGIVILGKKTGLLENDAHLYDEYDSTK
ncbi:methanol dehydrogenase [Enterococcus hermanniensis]|uniref:Methanol dehydrogenase n=1 Tax=Enterococcus hermanniensis TaxID=249189 RepID=A0A1L8TPS9_9ENTE|nr:methanol dehydrogenase [Enterococcus hermanniensis]OJG46287.1 hypothetical protein RV04_GL001453 [Enterococcus hermanniensis]